MQLFIIDWSFESAEDQLFATKEFCEYFNTGKLNTNVDGFNLIFMAHTPQDGSGTIICKAQNISIVISLLKAWRDSYSIAFSIKPALSNEEFVEIQKSTEN